MDISEFAPLFENRIKELQNYLKSDEIKDVIGREAQDHFKESFVNEGFTDESLEKWPDVKRRDSESEWYGHSGQDGKFSSTRTTAKILTGESGDLGRTINFVRTERGVRVFSEKPYARVHNFGGMAKIYGKKAFQMLARPFIGRSVTLVRRIEDKIRPRIKEFLTR